MTDLIQRKKNSFPVGPTTMVELDVSVVTGVVDGLHNVMSFSKESTDNAGVWR